MVRPRGLRGHSCSGDHSQSQRVGHLVGQCQLGSGSGVTTNQSEGHEGHKWSKTLGQSNKVSVIKCPSPLQGHSSQGEQSARGAWGVPISLGSYSGKAWPVRTRVRVGQEVTACSQSQAKGYRESRPSEVKVSHSGVQPGVGSL